MTLPRAENVGVIAADVYFPSTFVAQSALEECDGVPAGKYTKGLGQEAMAAQGPHSGHSPLVSGAAGGFF